MHQVRYRIRDTVKVLDVFLQPFDEFAWNHLAVVSAGIESETSTDHDLRSRGIKVVSSFLFEERENFFSHPFGFVGEGSVSSSSIILRVLPEISSEIFLHNQRKYFIPFSPDYQYIRSISPSIPEREPPSLSLMNSLMNCIDIRSREQNTFRTPHGQSNFVSQPFSIEIPLNRIGLIIESLQSMSTLCY